MSWKKLILVCSAIVSMGIMAGCTAAQLAAMKRKQAEREALSGKKVYIGKPVQAKSIAVGKSTKKPETGHGARPSKRALVARRTREAGAADLDAPPELAYPRKLKKTLGRVELRLESIAWDQPDYRLSSFIVNLYANFVGKAVNEKRNFYMEMGLNVGYPSTSLNYGDVDGYFSDGYYDSEFDIPCLGFHLNLIASEIKMQEAGLFEIETQIRFHFIFGSYPDETVYDIYEADQDIADVSSFTMAPRIQILLRRMAGDPEPLNYFEPFAGLSLNFMLTSISIEEGQNSWTTQMFGKEEEYFDIWVNLIIGVRVRPVKNLYGELRIIAGPNETTIEFAVGFMG